ncbi:uncharacterized protein LOC122790603 [Protopterus annectens]|uniref:uncharacterized protein LOC122790603 n=1 Tax=Protopterus annectens TaxID=7888 RepID=UPI001CFBA06D|nr:uncharacterized protein LOC122790603 [Protopterus annectens]
MAFILLNLAGSEAIEREHSSVYAPAIYEGEVAETSPPEEDIEILMSVSMTGRISSVEIPPTTTKCSSCLKEQQSTPFSVTEISSIPDVSNTVSFGTMQPASTKHLFSHVPTRSTVPALVHKRHGPLNSENSQAVNNDARHTVGKDLKNLNRSAQTSRNVTDNAGPATQGPTKISTQSSVKTKETSTRQEPEPKNSSWLPIMQKHDIPIVVGVSVSLTLIFITMGVYHLTQKKTENTETNRHLLRDSVPSSRNSSNMEACTYENKAYEEDITDVTDHIAPSTSPLATNSITVTAEFPPSQQKENVCPDANHDALPGNTILETTLLQDIDMPLHHRSKEHGNGNFRDSVEQMVFEPVIKESGKQKPDITENANKTNQTKSAEEQSCTTINLQEVEGTLTNMPANEENASSTHFTGIPAPLVLSQCITLNDRNSTGITTVSVDIHLYPAVPDPTFIPGSSTSATPVPFVPARQISLPECDQRTTCAQTDISSTVQRTFL